MRNRRSIAWNAGLLLAGNFIYVLGMKAVLIPHQLLSGGLVGISLILHYLASNVDIGISYFLLNIPLAILGWRNISRRFMLYTVFGMASFSVMASLVDVPPLKLEDPILAALLAGVVCGVGCGTVLRSVGSGGGLDILAIYANLRWGLRPGMVAMSANSLVLLAGVWLFDLDMVLYSIIYVFVNGQVLDAVLTGFNRRKSVLIVSSHTAEIVDQVLHGIHRGVTLLKGRGGYSGDDKDVIFTITTLPELAKLKELVYRIDPNAFMVINDTLEVLGKRHGSRKVY
jgi:uncharacterized membrane-anchored protein YitT (DUF2179 family)